jgi:ATP adenylyltransferase
VVPYRHIPNYTDATTQEILEYGELTQKAMQVLKSVGGAHGFNIGMNQGEVAGAGIASHLHQHIVPRWRNDANFFPIIAQTKALPKLLGDVRVEIANAWLNNS